MPGNLLTLTEAAERLGVSRRRVDALVLAGQLAGERVGRQWVVPAVAVRRAEHTRWRAPGRPLAQLSAWKLLAAGPSKDVELDWTRRRLRARARHREFYVHPGMLARLRDDARLVLGGREAASAFGAPVDSGEEFDAYVRAGQLEAFLEEYVATEVVEGANLHLHVVEDAAWPFDDDSRLAGPWVAWLDLADRQDRAADALLDRLIGVRFDA